MARQLSDHLPNFLYSTSMPCHGPSGHVKVEVLRKGELLDLDIELKSQPHLVLAAQKGLLTSVTLISIVLVSFRLLFGQKGETCRSGICLHVRKNIVESSSPQSLTVFDIS